MNRSLYPLAWCYVAAFTLSLLAFHVAGAQDPTRITTTPVAAS